MSRPATALRLLLVTPNFENNSLGRTYCLWLLARHLGYSVRVVGVKGHHIWKPLANNDFAADCWVPGDSSTAVLLAELDRHVAWSEIVIAVKSLPSSFGVAIDACSRVGRPLILDVDDPDLEVRTSWLPWYERVARRVLKPRYRQLLRLRRRMRDFPVMVSNPTLAVMHPGLIVPHVRPAGPDRLLSGTGETTVRFVGSPRGHKGAEELRSAVGALWHKGFRLEVTADAPGDAKPWETWLGFTDIAEGAALVAAADIIAVPSLDRSWARAQLPAKLMDAMMAGRAIVASDLPPIRWALGDSGLLVRPGDVEALIAALEQLGSRALRESLGESARARAVARYSVEAIAPAFDGLIHETMMRYGPTAGVASGADIEQQT